MTAPIPAEWITAAAEAIEEAAWPRIGRDLGTIHRDEIVAAGLRAALPLIIESIAARFDARAHAAERATRDMARTERDVDVVMAWWSGARLVREHASAAAVSSTTGTPDRPTAEPPFCHRCGHACAHTPPHPLIETPDGPVCEDVTWCTQLQHADEMTRICSDCGAARGTHANAGCEACAEYVVETPNRWPATSPTGETTDAA